MYFWEIYETEKLMKNHPNFNHSDLFIYNGDVNSSDMKHKIEIELQF